MRTPRHAARRERARAHSSSMPCCRPIHSAFSLIVFLAFSALVLSAQEATVVSFPHQGGVIVADSAYQGIAATSVTIGAGGPNNAMPCLDCVPDTTGSATFGDPLYLLGFAGNGYTPLDVTLLIEDTAYTGPCTGVYVLVQGGVTILSGKQEIFGGCVAGTDYIFYWSIGFRRVSSAPSGELKGGVAISNGPVV